MTTRLLMYLNLLALYSLSGLEILLTHSAAGLTRLIATVGALGFKAWQRNADLRDRMGR